MDKTKKPFTCGVLSSVVDSHIYVSPICDPIQLDPIGALTLQFEDGETFQWSKVTSLIYNIILPKLVCDHYGEE